MRGRVVKVLVAETNAMLADALGDLFADANGGRPVLTARTVDQALDIASREAPDLVVIDHWMGHETIDATVVELLRRSPRSSVVVLTTRADDSMVSRMRALGASCIDKEELHDSARGLVESAGGR